MARSGTKSRSAPWATPLVESVLRNGGYRCASNHVRRPIQKLPASTSSSESAVTRALD